MCNARCTNNEKKDVDTTATLIVQKVKKSNIISVVGLHHLKSQLHPGFHHGHAQGFCRVIALNQKQDLRQTRMCCNQSRCSK